MHSAYLSWTPNRQQSQVAKCSIGGTLHEPSCTPANQLGIPNQHAEESCMLPTTSPECPEKLTVSHDPTLVTCQVLICQQAQITTKRVFIDYHLALHARNSSGTECRGRHCSTLVRFANTTDKRREAAVDMNTYQRLLTIRWDLGQRCAKATPFKK